MTTTCPPTPITLIELAALPEGRGRRVCKGGLDLALFRVGDQVHAIDDSCPHAGASLSNARLQGTRINCPAHGLKFDLVTSPMAPCAPPVLDVRRHRVRVLDGVVLLVSDAPMREAIADLKR